MHSINICDAKEIPFIDVRWDMETTPPVINMQPHPHEQARIIVDLIKLREWNGFTILYESGKLNPGAYYENMRQYRILVLCNNIFAHILRFAISK